MFCFLALSIGCAGSGRRGQNASNEPEPQLVADFDNGLKLLEAEDYEQASRAFESLLVNNPTSEFEIVTLFNAGAAREGMKDCQGAADRYRKVVALAEKIPQLKSQSLYRLSFAYECLGQDEKVIATLSDVRRTAFHFPEETLQAELPARLAAAYARLGNSQQAKVYYDQADKGLASLKLTFKTKAKYNGLLARTLFFMGRITLPDQRAQENPDVYLENVRALQPYLHQAIELEAPIWSDKAFKQLKNSYEQLWTVIAQAQFSKSKDPMVRQNSERLHKIEIAKSAALALAKLKMLQSLQEVRGGFLEKLNFFIAGQEKKLHKLVAENSETTLPSMESRQREGLRRQGRIRK